jgi:hypothetical protein
LETDPEVNLLQAVSEKTHSDFSAELLLEFALEE